MVGLIKRSASVSVDLPLESSNNASMAHHGWRKGSLPGSGTSTLLSDGIKFDPVQGDQREGRADKNGRSPAKLLKPRRRIPSAAQDQSPIKKPSTHHLSSLMPAFGQSKSRDRSESCGASFTPNASTSNQPLQSMVPVTATNPIRSKPIPPRPRMIRKASSAGELGSLLPYDAPSIPHSSSQERPTKDLPAPPEREPDSHITPGRKPRYDSLQASPSPLRPTQKGPLLPRARQMSNGDIQPRPLETSLRQSVRRKPLPVPEPRQAPVQISMHSQGKSQVAELEVDSDGATIVLNCSDPVEFEWKCVSASGDLGSRWELRIRRPDGVQHTPMPFSPSSFTNTPSLSPASLRTTSPSPTPSTPAFRSASAPRSQWGPRESSPVLFADPFLAKEGTPKRSPWPPSPCTQDFSSGSDSPPLPSTPKRNGFVLPPGFTSPMNAKSPRSKSHASFRSSLSPYREQSAISFMTSQSETYAISPPTTPQRRHASSASKATARPQSIRRPSSDEDDWDGYADILEQANRLSGDSFKPSGLMLLSPPDETSALARRRVGNKAFDLRLTFDQSPPPVPKHEVEISRWSETEGGESEDDSSFSESRPTSFSM